VLVKPDGPDQLYVSAGTPPVVVPVKVSVLPTQIGDELDADAVTAVAKTAVIEVPLLILSVPADPVAPHPYNLNFAV